MVKSRTTPPEVNAGKCISCGLCIEVCPSFVLDLMKTKSTVVRGQWCIGCGQCGAICPTEAIFHEATSFEKAPKPGPGPATSPETLEILVRERRSVRSYDRGPIPDEILKKILRSGTYAPTGTNSQNVHYIVLTSPAEIARLREMTIRFYAKIFSRARGRLTSVFLRLAAGRKVVDYLRQSLPKVEHAREKIKEGKDCLFYHAPVVMLAHAESWDTCSSFNCSVALYNCSLMAHTLGIGCCFNGFLVSAANHDRSIKKWLSIPGDHRCYAAMTLGYQKLKYGRFVRRNPPKVTWRRGDNIGGSGI